MPTLFSHFWNEILCVCTICMPKKKHISCFLLAVAQSFSVFQFPKSVKVEPYQPNHWWHCLTLHNCVGCLNRGQVGDDGDIIISVGALDVDVDGALNLTMQARDHPRRVGDVSQPALTVVPGTSTEKKKIVAAYSVQLRSTEKQLIPVVCNACNLRTKDYWQVQT